MPAPVQAREPSFISIWTYTGEPYFMVCSRGEVMATKQKRAASADVTTVNLPGVTAELHPPDHYIPTRDDLDSVVGTVREYLPSREMTAWFAGLGLLGAFSVIEWPVAAAIGLGTVVAQRAGSAASSSSTRSSSQ